MLKGSTSMTIYPTYLYIKQHSVTGLKYFGKTTNTYPYKYNGSGKHWKSHIKKHGKEHIKTLWVSEPYIDSDIISKFALSFSKDNNIVESKEWANLIEENGLDGGVRGYIRSDESREKQSITMTGKTRSDETRDKMSVARMGKPSPNAGGTLSDNHKVNISIAMSGKTQSDNHIANNAIAHTKLHDILTPHGFLLEQISIKELCSMFNLKYNSINKYFWKYGVYQGFVKI